MSTYPPPCPHCAGSGGDSGDFQWLAEQWGGEPENYARAFYVNRSRCRRCKGAGSRKLRLARHLDRLLARELRILAEGDTEPTHTSPDAAGETSGEIEIAA